MKKYLSITIIFYLISLYSFSQGNWTQKNDFIGTARFGATSFSIGDKIYLGLGNDGSYLQDFWEWDQVADVWTQKANFGGVARSFAIGFSIGTKGYIGTGNQAAIYLNDFWEWDQSTNIWSQKSNCGTAVRSRAVGFAIGNKGYIGTGTANTGISSLNDFWEWDQASNVWTQKADVGSTPREAAVGFSIGLKGYVGTGINGIDLRDFWEWDQASNVWTQKANFGGVGRKAAVGFSIGAKGYIGTGTSVSLSQFNDLWEFDPSLNIWVQKANLPTGRSFSCGNSIGGFGYLSTGSDGTNKFNDLWEFDPSSGCTSVSMYSQPSNQSVTVGSGAAFSVAVNGTAPFTYQWQESTNGGSSWLYLSNSGNTIWSTVGSSSTLNISNVTTGQNNYLYRCVVSNSCPSSDTSTAATLTVNAIINQYSISTQLPYLVVPFLNPCPIANGSTSSNAPVIKICADASEATRISYINNNPGVNSNNIRFWIESDPYGNHVDTTGYFINYNVSVNEISATYAHPKYINSNHTAYREDRILVVDYTNPSIPEFQIPIQIYRAPILFVHGLYGDASTFSEMSFEFTAGSIAYPTQLNTIINYHPSSLANFVVNAQIVPLGIYGAFQKALSGNFSCGKVDVVGHSMGGILARLYLQENYGNIYRGDINKLITLNTPHSGSFLADAGVMLQSLFFSFECGLSNLLGQNSLFCNNALIDMQTYSYATDNILNSSTSLARNHVPSHSITTTLTPIPRIEYSSAPFLLFEPSLSAILELDRILLNGNQSDMVVPLSSQTGGLTGGATSNPTNHLHMGSAADPDVIDEVKQLLSSDPNGGNFSLNGFNPVNLRIRHPMPKTVYSTRGETKKYLLSSTVDIISPTNSSSFIPGQAISITINSDTSIKRLVVMAGNFNSGVTSIDTNISSTLTDVGYTIPVNAIGVLEIDVLGFDSQNNIVASDSVTFNTNTTASLDSMVVTPDILLTPTNIQSSFSVNGYFSDGVQRDITFVAGVQYTMVNPTIAQIVSPGIFEGLLVDSTQLIVTFQGVTDTIPVYVYDGDSLAHALFSSNTNAICDSGQIVFFNLSSGHPTSIQWLFPGGTPANSTDSIPVVFYNTIGTYPVSLIATYPNRTDSLNLSDFVTVDTRPASVLGFVNDTIYCSYVNGYAYQWFYNGNPIDSSYQNYILPDSTGNYFVDVMNNAGCIARSDTFYYSQTNINYSSSKASLMFYPNPAHDALHIKGQGLRNEKYKIVLFNLIGQTLIQFEVVPENGNVVTSVEMNQIQSGIYFISIESPSDKKVFKVQKL